MAGGAETPQSQRRPPSRGSPRKGNGPDSLVCGGLSSTASLAAKSRASFRAVRYPGSWGGRGDWSMTSPNLCPTFHCSLR